jgi:hypothetical protein
MGHTWIQKPKILPPTIVKHYLVDNVIRNMPNCLWVCLKVIAPIQGKLRCDGGQVRECKTAVHATIFVPINVTKLAFGAVLPTAWLKGVWWTTKAVKIANLLLKVKRVENEIKKLVDSADLICQGKGDVYVESKLELKEPIWLNEEGKPMYVLPADRAQLERQVRRLA